MEFQLDKGKLQLKYKTSLWLKNQTPSNKTTLFCNNL
jgi:hypothetical protein